MLEPGAEMESTDSLAPDLTKSRQILCKEADPPPWLMEFPFCILTTRCHQIFDTESLGKMKLLKSVCF